VRPTALTIAGFDPSGGAGLQADLRAFAACGVTGMSAATALTVQDSEGVRGVFPTEPAVLAGLLEVALPSADAVKIGMLGGAPQVRVAAEALRRQSPPHVVLDPVLSSTDGVSLLDAVGREALVSDLLPLATLVTPNLSEAASLAGLPVAGIDGMRRAGRRLMEMGARGALVTGGHLPGDPVDLLITAEGEVELRTERVDTPHTRGTGCVLSSAVAAFLARGLTVFEAAREAQALVARALRRPVVPESGRGYPDLSALPGPSVASGRPAAIRGLYVITDPHLRPDRSHEEIVRAALAGGANLVQLRDKSLPTPKLVGLAARLLAPVREAGASLIINDRVDVALAAGAAGVHLGPDDMWPMDARRLLGPDAIIGVSVSTVSEAAAAAPWATYAAVGAVFGSSTKADAGPPVGCGRIAEIKRAFPDLPIVAVGGITRENIGSVAAAGADAAAVISAVVAARDMKEAVKELVERFALASRR
jgi:hydroxymethylpyrimidine kinase/phosphomethylpyrimidine kinase/thiamine-phosphate diphosphorylase